MENQIDSRLEVLNSVLALNNMDDAGIEQSMSAILNMPDDQFMLIAPTLLGELKLSFNDPNNRIQLVQALNNEGLKVEDMINAFTELMTAVQEHRDEFHLSTMKVNFVLELLGSCVNSLNGVEGIAKRNITIPIEICDERARIPEYAHLTDAGLDVFALEDITIGPGETVLVPTGIKVAVPVGYELQVRPKSGICLKTKLRVANSPGTIDSGYRGEVGVIVDNIDPPIKHIYTDEDGRVVACDFGSSYTIGEGQKFAQLVLKEQPKVLWQQLDSIMDVESDGRDSGGYGSTGL